MSRSEVKLARRRGSVCTFKEDRESRTVPKVYYSQRKSYKPYLSPLRSRFITARSENMHVSYIVTCWRGVKVRSLVLGPQMGHLNQPRTLDGYGRVVEWKLAGENPKISEKIMP